MRFSSTVTQHDILLLSQSLMELANIVHVLVMMIKQARSDKNDSKINTAMLMCSPFTYKLLNRSFGYLDCFS